MILLMLACSDYEVNKEGDGPAFDTGGDAPFHPDTTEDSQPVDTVDTAPPPECPDQAFPGEALTLDDDCTTAPTVGSFTPVVEWTVDSFATESGSDNVMSTPIVISLTDDDGDGDADENDIPDVIFVTYSGTSYSGPGVMRAVSGDDGHSLWDTTDGSPAGCAGIAAADLDDDGFPEVIASTLAHELSAYAADGSLLWTSGSYGNAGFAAPAIADLDADGEPEIVAGASIFDADGNTLAVGSGTDGSGSYYTALSFPVDLDGDGEMEIIAGPTVYDRNGNELWAGGGDGSPAVGDFDLDGAPEVVNTSAGSVTMHAADGTLLWTTKLKTASTGGPPTIADYDGDGAPEIGVATNASYSVLDGDGTVLWEATTTDASSGVTGSAVFDFEGDGIAEVVYADEINVWAFNGPDGTAKFSTGDHSNWTVVEYPVIADIDADDEAEIVVPNGLHPSYGTAYHGITVLGDADHSWRPGRRIWNQHAYHITNIEDDGSVPVHQEPNWETYNNFRSGDLTALTGSDGQNLVVRIDDVCADECASGTLVVWVSIGDRGPLDVEGTIDVRLEVESPVGWVEVGNASFGGPVPSGSWTDAQQVELTGLPEGPLTALRATVDPGDDEHECHEEDNTAETRDSLCL